VFVAFECSLSACAAEPTALSALARLPVTEITVFKDGHAYVLHQGSQPVDEQGDVKLDTLPSPEIGTFWPYSADKVATLASVSAGRWTVKVERNALTIRDEKSETVRLVSDRSGDLSLRWALPA